MELLDPIEIVGAAPERVRALAYRSVPVVPFSDRDLSDLLLAAQRANAHYGVTGRLYALEEESAVGFSVVRFLQWIEGPPASVAAVYARIAADPRHGALEVVRDGPAPGRRFPEWTMTLDAVGPAAFADATGRVLARAA